MAEPIAISEGVLVGENGPINLTIAGTLDVATDISLNGLITNEGDGMGGSRSFSATELFTTGSRISTNGLVRIVLPDAATTSVFAGPVGLPGWWLKHGMVIGFDCVNDHSATGNVRWRVILRKFNSFGSVTTPTVALDSTITLASPSANGGMATLTNAAWVNFDVTQDGFGSLYCCEIQRVGADGADTLAGPMGISEVSLARGTL